MVAAANQPRAQASIIDRPVRHRLVWGARPCSCLLALATVVSGLNWSYQNRRE